MLAGWLKVFGVSTAALLGFQCLMYLLISRAALVILRHYQAEKIWEWLVPLAVAAAFFPEGLRPESTSVALAMIGFALIPGGAPGRVRLTVAFFLMIFGAVTAERLVFFSAALGLAALWELTKNGVPFRRSLTLAGLAGLAVGILSMYWIDFKLGEFWTTFHMSAAGRMGGAKVAAVIKFFHELSIIQWPIIGLTLALFPLAVRFRNRAWARTGLWLAAAFGVTAGIGALGHGAVWYFSFLLCLSGAGCAREFSVKSSRILFGLIMIVLLIANARNFIYAAGIMGGKIKADPGNQWAAARAWRAGPQHPVLLDMETARYVFDYKIPRGFLDWTFSSKFPKTLPTDEPLHPDDIYLIGPSSVDWLNLKTHLNLAVPKWQPIGLNKGFHRFPCRVYIIHPADCRGLN
jgi:hypothetical protein